MSVHSLTLLLLGGYTTTIFITTSLVYLYLLQKWVDSTYLTSVYTRAYNMDFVLPPFYNASFPLWFSTPTLSSQPIYWVWISDIGYSIDWWFDILFIEFFALFWTVYQWIIGYRGFCIFDLLFFRVSTCLFLFFPIPFGFAIWNCGGVLPYTRRYPKYLGHSSTPIATCHGIAGAYLFVPSDYPKSASATPLHCYYGIRIHSYVHPQYGKVLKFFIYT